MVPDNLTIAAASWMYADANCSMPLVTAGKYNITITAQDSNYGWGDAQPANFAAIGESMFNGMVQRVW